MSRTELEVARDAVRTVYGDELADALEWAAAAVKHRLVMMTALRRFASGAAGTCADCGQGYTHRRDCRTAAALHALDDNWSQDDMDRAHGEALEMARQRSDGPWRREYLGEFPRRDTASFAPIIPSQQAAFGPPRDPARLTYSAGTAWPALPLRLRPSEMLSVALEDSGPLVLASIGEGVVGAPFPVAHADSPDAVPTVSVTSGVDADASTEVSK